MVFVVSAESVNSVSSGAIYAEMELKDRNVKFQVDCGATVNVISQKYVSEESLEKSDTKLTMYNKTTLRPIVKYYLKLLWRTYPPPPPCSVGERLSK